MVQTKVSAAFILPLCVSLSLSLTPFLVPFLSRSLLPLSLSLSLPPFPFLVSFETASLILSQFFPRHLPLNSPPPLALPLPTANNQTYHPNTEGFSILKGLQLKSPACASTQTKPFLLSLFETEMRNGLRELAPPGISKETPERPITHFKISGSLGKPLFLYSNKVLQWSKLLCIYIAGSRMRSAGKRSMKHPQGTNQRGSQFPEDPHHLA